jgi:hypothetical protein
MEREVRMDLKIITNVTKRTGWLHPINQVQRTRGEWRENEKSSHLVNFGYGVKVEGVREDDGADAGGQLTMGRSKKRVETTSSVLKGERDWAINSGGTKRVGLLCPINQAQP